MKKIFVLLTTVLLLASCAKKETANTPPPEGAKPPAAKAGGHPSGGSITQINPPGVTGQQAGAISFTIQPTGHSNPALDGNPTSIWYMSTQPNDTMIVTLPTGSTQKFPMLANLPNRTNFAPSTDSTQVQSYQVNFTRNGLPFTGVFSGPSNTTVNIGYQSSTYFMSPATPNSTMYLWCIVNDQTVIASN
jgi:hypothetical protein